MLVEVVDDKPSGNPALAGVPPRPRRKHCRTLLSAGRCVEPECGKEQDGGEATADEAKVDQNGDNGN